MGKIPQVGFDALPASGVPRGPFPQDPGGAGLLKTASGGVEELAHLRGLDERNEVVKLRRAMDAKLAITNEVTATRKAGDFEEELRGSAQQLQAQFADSPQDALTPFLDSARKRADEVIKDVPNSETGIIVARKTSASIDSSMTQMHAWVQDRLTQKAKVDLATMTNRVSQGAESQMSPAALETYLAGKEKELSPLFQNIHGHEAATKLQEMKTDATRSWVLSAGDRDPIGTLQALDSPKGPLVDNLNTSQRESLRKSTMAAFEGFGKIREMQIIKDGVDQNRNVFDAFREGSLNAGTMAAAQRANAEQQKAVSVDPKYDKDQKASQIEALKSQAQFLTSLETVRRRQLTFDAIDDPNTVASLIQRQQDLFKKDKGAAGKNLADALKFQNDLAAAAADKKLSGGTFATMFKSLSLDLPKAIDTESRNTWHLGWPLRSPRESGNSELNTQLQNGVFRELPVEKQNAARISYIQDFNAAVESGRSVDEASARKMALKALSLETGIHIPGVNDK